MTLALENHLGGKRWNARKLYLSHFVSIQRQEFGCGLYAQAECGEDQGNQGGGATFFL